MSSDYVNSPDLWCFLANRIRLRLLHGLCRDVVEPTPCVPGLRIKQVSAGGMHSCVLTDTGEVRVCKYNTNPPTESLHQYMFPSPQGYAPNATCSCLCCMLQV